MKTFAAFLALSAAASFAAPFELKDGDRVLLLGDALLERENTYGHLETRMHEQFPNVRFSVRNLSWSGETPKGWSRASFDAPAKGWERLKENIATVKPTVAILGFGMAASLQEITDRSGDIMLNADTARYGAEPMSAPRFKKEMGELMDAIKAGDPNTRFVLLSPIRHEDLRKTRPGLPDPTPHNALLDQYSKALQELAQERQAVFCPADPKTGIQTLAPWNATHNGVTLSEEGHAAWATDVAKRLEWTPATKNVGTLRPAILRKNDLFFHQFRPANSTYLFGFRKHEQGKNAAEMPKFTPIIETVDKEIDTLKRQPNAKAAPTVEANPKSDILNPKSTLPLPNFSLSDNLEITLWADTNLVGKPVGMNWDAAGRLWVACSPVYPQIAPGDHPEDKVVVLEDTDRDGKADKTTTFASNLLIAAGVAPDFAAANVGSPNPPSNVEANRKPSGARQTTEGGPKGERGDASQSSIVNHKSSVPAAYVGASTELLRLEDTNGDGLADERRIVLSGFGTEDTHHTIHTLRWGPDGRLYFNQSIYIHSHMETPWGMVRLNSAGICAYDPGTERVEVHAKGWCNPWGHVWDQWGQEFVTDGAGSQGLSWLVPGAMYFTYENARKIMPSVSPGSYPKYCGLELVQSPLFPADWQGQAITCDFRAHRIVRFQINDLGDNKADPSKPALSGYVTKELQPPVTTTDSAFRPIDVKLGPDGALYIADWTNPIINHGEVDFRDPRRDHVNGRIWRLAPKGSTPVKWEALAGKDVPTLAEAVLSANAWHAENAHRALLSLLHNLIYFQFEGKPGEPREKSAKPNLLELAAAQIKDVVGAHLATPSARLLQLDLLAGRSIFSAEGKGKITFPLGGDPKDSDRLQFIDLEDGKVGPLLMASKDPRDRALWVRFAGLEASPSNSVSATRKFQDWLVTTLAPFARDPSPRVRLEAMRVLSRLPSAKSAELVLEAAVNAPGGKEAAAAALPGAPKQQFDNATASTTGDSHYAYAAWLSVNDLAPQVIQWVEQTSTAENADGAGSARGPRAVPGGSPGTSPATQEPNRDAMIAYALQSLRAEQTNALLTKIIATQGVPKDGSGPWIELIGQSGGPKELRILLDALFAATTPDSDLPRPLADAKHLFTSKDANRRAAAALVAAARRGATPADRPKGGWQFFYHAPGEAAADVVRLAGLWKEPGVANAVAARIDGDSSPAMLDAVFESLRTMASDEAATALGAFFAPKGQEPDAAFLRIALRKNSPEIRRRALGALGAFRPDAALASLNGVLAENDEKEARALWRDLFASDKFNGALLAKMPKLEPKHAAVALRAARELGRKGEKLAAALTPLAGEAAPAAAPADFNWLVDFTKKNGSAAEGELVYRRAALACTVCHAIGGAGGKVGPDMTTIGASAPLDYLIESTMAPAVKVKEGYHAVALTLKGGRAAAGIQARETERDIILRDATGAEQTVAKADITGKENIGSLMPPGLTATLNDREKAHLFAFLSQLGKPGPFDATKATVARTWDIFPGKDAEKVVSSPGTAKPAARALTLTDGRLPKAQLAEALQLVPDAGETILVVTRFTTAAPVKSRLHLQGATKAWLNGAPLAIASDPNPVIDFPAGNQTLAIKLDTKSLPEVLRAECPEARFLND